MRFNRPVGILLLWLPTAWGLWLANQGPPPYDLLVYFLVGTILMRAAGCVVNDIADRHIDIHVKRTAQRPLTSGEIGLFAALNLLVLLLLAAFMIAIQLPRQCFYYAVFALCITILYPFCKRFLQAPQLILGLAFSMGIPMAYAASGVSIDTPMLVLLLLNFLWIVSYDTMYAMVDCEDDLRIGVKSTAVLFGSYDYLIILLLQIAFHCLWLYLASSQYYSSRFYVGWVVGLFILIYQQTLVNQRTAHSSFKAFSMNAWYGTIMWATLIISYQ